MDLHKLLIFHILILVFCGGLPLAAQPYGLQFLVNSTVTDKQSAPDVARNLSGDNTVAVWESNLQDGSGSGIFGQCYDANLDEAGTEFQINTTTAADQSDPSVAVGPAGGFVVVWASSGQDGGGWGIYGQRFLPNGNKTGSEFPVNTTTTNDQDRPAIAMDENGNFVVAWRSSGQDGSGWGIFGQRFDSTGTKIGAEFPVNTTTANEQQDPAVAMSQEGAFVIVWQSFGQDGDGWGVYGRRYNALGTAQGSEFLVNTETINYQEQPDVAMDEDGDFVVVWQSLNQAGGTSNYDIYGQRFGSDGLTAGNEFPVNTYLSSSQSNAAVAMDSMGNFTVVWQSNFQDFSNEGIYAQQFDDVGNTVGSEFIVNTSTTGDQIDAAAAIDGAGNWLVVWHDENTLAGVVYAQAYHTGSGVDVLVNNTTSGSQLGAQIAMDKMGNYVVTWYGSGNGDSNNGIYAQRFDAGGNKLGGEFLVNTTTISSQAYPDIAMDESGNYVVVWASFAQDGNLWEIFGQRYSANGNPDGNEFQVNTTKSGDQLYPTVALNNDGSFIVAWQSLASVIVAQSFDANGTKSGSEVAVSTVGGDNEFPDIASDGKGSFVIVWQASSFSLSAVYGQLFDDTGAPTGSNFPVSAPFSSDRCNVTPAVTMNAEGHFIVTWSTMVGGPLPCSRPSNIAARLFDADGDELYEFLRVNSTGANVQTASAAILDDKGFAVVVWQSEDQDGSGEGIYGQALGIDGKRLGLEFRINTYTTSDQEEPAIAQDSTGNFTVVWSSLGQDLSGWGVYGQGYRGKFKNGERYYVDHSAAGNNSGTDWTNAFPTLQDALDAASKFSNYDCNEIWVAEGTYLPTKDPTGSASPADNRQKTFYFDFDVAIYGGFAGTPGTEGDTASRDRQAYPTILSGDLGQNDAPNLTGSALTSDPSRNDNSYHVVHTYAVGDRFQLDGFTIEGGNANGGNASADPLSQGGGWLNLIDGSTSEVSSNPQIQYCTFRANASNFHGGGLYNISEGGFRAARPSIFKSLFIGNYALAAGGAFNQGSSGLAITHFYNCLFTQNGASDSSAVMASAGSYFSLGDTSQLNVVNSTIGGNIAANSPGVIGGENVSVYNSAIWHNVHQSGTNGEITPSATVWNSLVEGGWAGAGGNNLDQDPLFVYPPDPVNALLVPADFRLQECSPAIDLGDNSAPGLSLISSDLAGNNRFYNGGQVDIGAYELQVDQTFVLGGLAISTDCSNPTIVDFTGFGGAGFAPVPGPGQLSSEHWAINGFDDVLDFGGTATTGDLAKGIADGTGANSGGLYSLDLNGNQALWINAKSDDFVPGDITFKVCHRGGITIDEVDLSYDILYLNEQEESSSFNLSFSTDNITYIPVPALDFATPGPDNNDPVQTVNRATTLTGLGLTNQECLYLRWSSDDVGDPGGGSRDEFGLDNISICADLGLSDPNVCFRDLDGDGFGNPASQAIFCTPCGTGFVINNTDCNDDPATGGAAYSGCVALSIKTYLAGPLKVIAPTDSPGPGMEDSLRVKGLIPLQEPYTGLPEFTHVNGGGGETIDQALLQTTGDDALIDWLFLELRNELDSTMVEATKSVLLQADGDVVDVNLNAEIEFTNVDDGKYFVVVRHRNALGVMTREAIDLK